MADGLLEEAVLILRWATIFAAFMLIPYCVAALIYLNKKPCLRSVVRGGPYFEAVRFGEICTRATLIAQCAVMSLWVIRYYYTDYPVPASGPASASLISALIGFVLVLVLAFPASAFIELKIKIHKERCNTHSLRRHRLRRERNHHQGGPQDYGYGPGDDRPLLR